MIRADEREPAPQPRRSYRLRSPLVPSQGARTSREKSRARCEVRSCGRSNHRSNHVAPSEQLPEKLLEKLPGSPRSASRRRFVKGLGAAGATLPALAMLPRWGFAEDAAATYANAAIDWKQFAGQTLTLAG